MVTSSHLFTISLWIADVRIFRGAQSPVCERLWCLQRGIMGGRRAVNHLAGVGVISLSCCRLVLDGISLLAAFQGDWQQNNVWGPQRAPGRLNVKCMNAWESMERWSVAEYFFFLGNRMRSVTLNTPRLLFLCSDTKNSLQDDFTSSVTSTRCCNNRDCVSESADQLENWSLIRSQHAVVRMWSFTFIWSK